MDLLRVKYEEVRATEAVIRLELSKGREQFMKPTEEVMHWLTSLEGVQKRVDYIERSLEQSCFYYYSRIKAFGLVKEVTEAIDGLLRRSNFPNGLLVSDRSQLWPVPTLVGISSMRTLDKIWANLMDSTVGIIGIYGLGGVGKTTIMLNIKSPLATTKIFDKVFWVTVSKQLNYGEVQNEIALQLNLDLESSEYQAADNIELFLSQADKLFERLKKIKKFVIIFDDVWEHFSLDIVGIPNPNYHKGCKIVVISRTLGICQSMGSDKIVRVEVLSPDEAWDLFVSKAGSTALTRDIRPFARRVVQKCCHVPIVIISVGLALRDEVSIKVWRKALVELSAPVAQSHDIVLALLRYSYNRLRDEKVQRCFLYCAFFPDDHLFKSEEMIRYWMAEGFLHEDGDIITKTDDGLEILRKLLDANMLEKFTKGGDDWLKMHDLFRDLAIKIITEKEPGICVKAGVGLREVQFPWEQVEASKISFVRNHIERLDYYPANCHNASTLLLRHNPVSRIFDQFFSPMLALKFLDLSYTSITDLPSSLSGLSQLRALFLHYCMGLKKIPSLEQMKELQVLRLCGTSITALPDGMEALVNLKFLDLSETAKLENIEVGVISSLSCLEELRMQGSGLCKMDSPMVANYLMEMRSLKHLAVLSISTVCLEDLLDTLVCLQGKNLKIYFINLYGSAADYIDSEEVV